MPSAKNMRSHSANGQFLLKNYNRTLRSGIFINNIAIAQYKRPFLLTEVKSHAAIGHFSRQLPVCTVRLGIFCASCLFARCDWAFFAPAARLHAAIGHFLRQLPVCTLRLHIFCFLVSDERTDIKVDFGFDTVPETHVGQTRQELSCIFGIDLGTCPVRLARGDTRASHLGKGRIG